MWGDNSGNQAQLLLLSINGRYVWSEEPIKYEFNKGRLTVTTRSGIITNGTAGDDLRSACEFAVKNFFPSNGKIPDPLLFTHPQYNEGSFFENQQPHTHSGLAEKVSAGRVVAGAASIAEAWGGFVQPSHRHG
jgi:hypothetical protein